MSGELLDLARFLVDLARPDEELEAYTSRLAETRVDALDGEVHTLSSAETHGVGVRLVVGGRQGYASTSLGSRAALRAAVEEARGNAAVAEPDAANGLPYPEPPAEVDGLVGRSFHATTVGDRIGLALELEAAARAVDPRVVGVRTATYGDAHTEVAVASTRGIEVVSERTTAWAYVRPLAREGEETQADLGVTVGRSPADLDVEAAGREGALRALRLLGARKPPSGRMPVVLDPYVAASLLGVFAAALSAEAVVRGRSILAGRLRDEIASKVVTLVDDGLLPGGLATAPWDGEGVPQRTTRLVDRGRLVSYLHNTWTGRRLGTSSTGNASRAGHRSSPGVAPTNLHLRPGPLDAAAVLARAGDGLYVQEVSGLHSGVSPISGDLSIGVTGLAIRGGELAEPVREATVASTLLDLVAAIAEVGSDLRFLPFGAAIGGSSTLVGEMSVSGT